MYVHTVFLYLWNRIVTCEVIESSCSRSVSSSSNHIWKECAGPGLGYWRCGISYGRKLTTCGFRYRTLAPPFTSARDAAGTLPGPRRAANRMGGNLTQLRHRLQSCSRKIWPIVFKFSAWLGTAWLRAFHMSWLGTPAQAQMCTRFYIPVTAQPIVFKLSVWLGTAWATTALPCIFRNAWANRLGPGERGEILFRSI